jgi:hypothetical protein
MNQSFETIDLEDFIMESQQVAGEASDRAGDQWGLRRAGITAKPNEKRWKQQIPYNDEVWEILRQDMVRGTFADRLAAYHVETLAQQHCGTLNAGLEDVKDLMAPNDEANLHHTSRYRSYRDALVHGKPYKTLGELERGYMEMKSHTDGSFAAEHSFFKSPHGPRDSGYGGSGSSAISATATDNASHSGKDQNESRRYRFRPASKHEAELLRREMEVTYIDRRFEDELWLKDRGI